MLTIQAINSSIMFGDLSNEHLDSIVMAIRYRRNQLIRSVKRTIEVGDKVKFFSTKRNQTVTGTVEKVAIKYITINAGTGRWKVPANMLEII